MEKALNLSLKITVVKVVVVFICFCKVKEVFDSFFSMLYFYYYKYISSIYKDKHDITYSPEYDSS